MTSQIKLLTSQESFHKMHQLINGRKESLRIDKQTLTNLLVDYSVMLAALSKVSGFVVNEPSSRVRPRLEPNFDRDYED